MSFDGWLDARDGETAEHAWKELGATRRELASDPPPTPQIARMLGLRADAAALQAAAFLGCPPEQLAWFLSESWRTDEDPDEDDEPPKVPRPPPPIFEVKGRDVARCVLDGRVLCDQPCTESWQIREVISGSRGVQHVRIDFYYGEFTRDGSGGGGGSITIVRLFDRGAAQAVSIRLYWSDVYAVGAPIDLAALDLAGDRTELKLAWKAYDPESLRGLFAQLTADLDAHFDTAPSWPGGVIDDRVIDNKEYNFRVRRRVYRYESGPFAFVFDELLDPDGKEETGWLTVRVHGLPWGHNVSARIDSTDDPVFGVSGWLDLRLPRAQLEQTLARLVAIPNITITG